MSASSTEPYTFAEQVLDVAQREGLTREDLEDMVKRAARATHKLGNRRYHQYIFMVKDRAVVHLCKLGTGFDNSAPSGIITSERRVLDDDEFVVHDECEDCGGAGCAKCKGKGFVAVVRKTQDPLFKSTQGVGHDERKHQTGRFRR